MSNLPPDKFHSGRMKADQAKREAEQRAAEESRKKFEQPPKPEKKP